MKLESDLPALLPTATQGPNPGRTQQENGMVDPDKFKVVKKITDEKQEAFSCEDKGSEMIADSFPSEFSNEDGFWPVLDFECSVLSQDLTKGEDYEMVETISQDFHVETELLKRDSDNFTEKSFMEFGMPKGLACCKDDSDCCETSDICMEKVVIPDEKIRFETNTVPVAGEVLASNSRNEELEICHPTFSHSFEVPEDHCPVDAVRPCPEHLIYPAESSVTEDTRRDFSVAHVDEVEQQSAEALHDKSTAGTISILYDAEEVKDSHKEASQVSDSISLKSASTENCEELPIGTQMESGTMAFSPADSTQIPSDCIRNEEPLDDQVGPEFDDGHGYLRLVQQGDHGESSFSVSADLPSGHISYTGPVAYLGSLSCRSDSSVGTSTRSFAFPMYHFKTYISNLVFIMRIFLPPGSFCSLFHCTS
ncbi:hypothetical protein SAY87_016972 [Trapa incisa]|uniref:Uncharacterized protein n=1 Tax=Trapa incisa TaxID=236973 RepID=A0AAN7L7Q6_9MYRT|nr:hypothetical protein SAY87_016972 [Trapa incisa]